MISTSEHRREIVVVSPSYTGGDIGRAAGRLIEEIAARDDIHFTWAAGGNGALPAIPDQTILPMRGFDFFGYGGSAWKLWGPGSLKRLGIAIAAADLVWLHDTFYPGAIAAYRMAQKWQKPVIVTQHSAPPAGRFMTALADQLVTQAMLRGARQATFVSDAIAENYYRRVGFTAPVKIIPNGVDDAVFRPATIDKREHGRGVFALREDSPVLLYVGPFTAARGLPVIHHLARRLPDWHFWLAGQGSVDPAGWYLPNVQVFRNPDVAKRVELYQSADRLILPSDGSDFPLAIQEAMACGLPVLCSPAMAAGNHLARPHLLTAPVDPRAPGKTAGLWAAQLKKQRTLVPLMRPKIELAEVARIFWPWPKIAGYYADIFRGLARRAGPKA